jgi:hypothetical protein
MVASLLAATSVFGGITRNHNRGACAPQPSECCPPQAPHVPRGCGYNAPAEINIGCQHDIDFFASGSFIYWQPSQDNMDIGLTDNNPFLVPSLAAGTGLPTIQGAYIEMDYDFQPGFKVGLGMNLQVDDWDGYAEYTRVHGTHSTSSNGPSATSPSIFATFGSPYITSAARGIFSAGGIAFNTVYGKYKNNLDFVDAEMGRSYYVGKRLIFRPAWGARGAWILQNIHVAYNNTTGAISADPTGQIVSFPSALDVYQRSHSWAVGPRAGLTMDWMFGYGIRFFGSGYADILFTRYKIQDKSVLIPRVPNTVVATPFALTGNPISLITYDKVNAIRTHLDFEMGFGWGSYFGHHNWHVDLSASYGFQVFFSQNMFRHYDSGISVNSEPHGDLYVQGLTATVRFDF